MAMGGKRPGAGRKLGSVNKATAELRDIARRYVPAAMKELARLATKAESEQARVAAIKEINDRAYGKAPQAMEVSGPGGASLIPVLNVKISGNQPSSSS